MVADQANASRAPCPNPSPCTCPSALPASCPSLRDEETGQSLEALFKVPGASKQHLVTKNSSPVTTLRGTLGLPGAWPSLVDNN